MTGVYRERCKEDSQAKHIRIDFDTMKAAFIPQPENGKLLESVECRISEVLNSNLPRA